MYKSGLIITAAATVSRFPKPDFSAGYEYPALKLAAVEAAFRGYLDIAILIAVMSLTALTIYRWRSRFVFIALSLFSVLWFGIIRKGCPCAVGSIQSVFALFFHADAVIDLTVLLWFLIPLIAAFFFGRLYCGGACPLGAVQELLFIRRIPLPLWLWHVLGIIPVFYLGCAVAAAWTKAPNIICLSDPFLPVFHQGAVSGRGWLTLLFAGASLFIYRPYCRILCPYGVFQSAAAFLSGKRASISPDKCINCTLCEGCCPAGAVLPPDNPADTQQVRRKLFPLVAISITVTVALTIFGGYFGKSVSTLHPDVRLSALIERGDTTSIEALTFLEASGDAAALATNAAEITKKFALIMALSGAFAGLCFSASLASTEFRRKRAGHSISQKDCFLCTRCIHNCTREQLKRAKTKKTGEDIL